MLLRTRRALFASCVAIALGMTVAPPSAVANGRYPGAQYLAVGPYGRSDTLAMQTTFGLLMSTDSGGSWHWVCEQAEGYSAMADPTLALQRDGSLVITLPDGLSLGTSPYCDFPRPTGSPSQQVIDVSNDPNGTRTAVAVTPITGDNSVWISDDLGRTWSMGWSQAGIFIETIDIAPGHPDRMYLSAYATGAVPTIYRSDDGGQTFTATTTDTHGGYDAFIAAVDPIDPDVVYLRTDVDTGGTLLLRSSDGARTFTMVASTRNRMTGAAISPDGVHVWIAGRGFADGVLRSDDHGFTFHPVSNPFTTLCLRYANGYLFACTDYGTDGFALACSSDMGATFIPVLSFPDVQPSDHCAAGTAVHDRCSSLWPAQHSLLTADAGMVRPPTCTHDGGTCFLDSGSDAASDAGADAAPGDDTVTADVTTDAASDEGIDTFADAGHDSGTMSSGCHCSVPSSGRHAMRGPWLALIALAFATRPRRRSRG